MDAGVGEEVDVFVRKVEGGLDEGTQSGQGLEQVLDALRQGATSVRAASRA